MNALLSFHLRRAFLLLLVYVGCGRAAMAATDSLPPAALQQQLDQYRQANQLDAWIYARTDYAEASPQTRLAFLMQTQAAAWRSFETYDERLAWFNLLLLQGYYQLQSGNILASIKGYETALQFYDAYPLPDADNIPDYLLKPLGNNYTRLGDYEAALFIHGKTMQLVQARADRQEMASACNNMAISARWQGDLPAALRYCRQGLQLVNRSTPLYGLLLSTQADAYQESHAYDSAGTTVARAILHLQRFPQSPEARYWYGSALQVAAQVALRQQQYAAARRFTQEAARWFQHYYPDSRPREKARIDVLSGDLYLATRQAPAALQAYQSALLRLLPAWKPADGQAVPPASLLYSESLLTDAFAGKARAFTALAQPAAALQQYKTVFAAAARLQQAFLHTSARLQELELAKGRASVAMELAYTQWKQTNDGSYKDDMLLIAEHTKAQVLVYERARREPAGYRPADSVRRKMKQLQEAIVYYQRELAAQPNDTGTVRLLQATEYEQDILYQQTNTTTARAPLLTPERLRAFWQQLPADGCVLEFFAGKEHAYLIEVNRQGVQEIRRIDPGAATEAAIRDYVQHWYTQGPTAMVNDPRAFFTAGWQLYQTIFGNYTWHPKRRYLLIPDGQYSYLPFDALPVRDAFTNNYGQWPYLLQVANTSQAYSLQTFYQQQSTNYGPGGFTGFFVSRGRSGGQPVLAVQRECNSLQQQLAGSFYLDTAANWRQFMAHAGDPGVLHISSHAVAGGNDSVPYLQFYDQPFYLFDLRFRHFSPSLVVLGACKTADGQWLDGEGVNSLSRAFTEAGAGGVIAGRWNVHDEAAIDILQQCYAQLAQRQDAATALQLAKRHYLHQQAANNRMMLPYYWAALTYSGHLQAIRLASPPGGLRIVWLIGLGLIVIAGIVVYFIPGHPGPDDHR